MDIGLIFSLVFFALVVIGALRGVRRGKRKSWQNCLVRFIITLLSAVIAIFVSKAIASTIASTLYENFVKSEMPEEMLSMFEDVPSAPGIMLAMVSMVLAPILFYIVNFLIKLILKIFSPLFVSLLTSLTDSIAQKRELKKFASSSNAKSEDVASVDDSEPEASEFSEFDEAGEDSGDDKKKKKKPKKSREKKPKYFASGKGAAAGIIFATLTGIISVIIFFAPITGYFALLGMPISMMKDADIPDFDDSEEIVTILDEVTSNVGVKTANVLGGKLIFNGLTTYEVQGASISLYKETELMCTIGKALLTVANENKTSEDKSNALNEISPAFEKSNIIPLLLSEFLSGAASAWEAGEPFCGVELPGEDGAAKDLILEAVAMFKDATPATVKQDATTLVSITAILLEHGLIEDMPDDPKDLLGNKQLISDLFYQVFENDRLNHLINVLISTGVEMVTEMVGAPANLNGVHEQFLSELCAPKSSANAEELEAAYKAVFNKYGIDVTTISLKQFTNKIIDNYEISSYETVSRTDINSFLSAIKVNIDGEEKTINLSENAVFIANTLLVTADTVKPSNDTTDADSRAQADALADVFASVFDITDLFESEDETNIANTLKTLGGILDKFAACASIGKDCVDNLVVALLQSDMVYDVIAMDKVSATHFASAIIKDTGEGKSYADAMADIARVIDKITEVSENDDFDKDGIKEVLATLTPTTSTALKHIVTGNLAEQIGFEAANSEGVSDILSSVFDNISSAKESMTDEEYAAETEKIADLLDTTMNITGDSDESVDVETYVNSAMDSAVVSESLKENVFKDGETATIDPLETGTELGDEEKESLVNTLQTRIDNAADDEKEDTEKTAIAIAAYLNVRVEIVNGTVSIVEP